MEPRFTGKIAPLVLQGEPIHGRLPSPNGHRPFPGGPLNSLIDNLKHRIVVHLFEGFSDVSGCYSLCV